MNIARRWFFLAGQRVCTNDLMRIWGMKYDAALNRAYKTLPRAPR